MSIWLGINYTIAMIALMIFCLAKTDSYEQFSRKGVIYWLCFPLWGGFSIPWFFLTGLYLAICFLLKEAKKVL